MLEIILLKAGTTVHTGMTFTNEDVEHAKRTCGKHFDMYKIMQKNGLAISLVSFRVVKQGEEDKPLYICGAC